MGYRENINIVGENKFWDTEEILGVVDKNKTEKTVIRKTTLKGKEYREVKTFYTKDAGETYLPGKGISISKDNVPIVAALLIADLNLDHGEFMNLVERVISREEVEG